MARGPDERRRRGTGTVVWHRHKGQWMAQLRLGNGQRITRYFAGRPPPPHPWARDPRPSEAVRWLDRVRVEHETGVRTAQSSLTVGEQVAEWAALRAPSLSPSTARTYATVIALSRPLWDVRLDALRANHVQAWINQFLASDRAPKTAQLARSVLNQVMTAAVQWERIARNPVTHTEVPNVRPRRERRAWSAAEAQRFLDASRGDPYVALWTTLLYTGMRQGEARALTWADIDWTTATIEVAANLDDRAGRRGPTKTGTRQRIPMVGALERALSAHRARSVGQIGLDRARSGYVFTRPDGRPITGETVRWHFRRACVRAGLEPLLPHELRHTAATLMADAGVPLLTVASILGHATTDQLRDTYFHAHQDERRKALETLSERLSG